MLCATVTPRRAELQSTQATVQTFIQLSSETSAFLNASTQPGVSLEVATRALRKGVLRLSQVTHRWLHAGVQGTFSPPQTTESGGNPGSHTAAGTGRCLIHSLWTITKLTCVTKCQLRAGNHPGLTPFTPMMPVFGRCSPRCPGGSVFTCLVSWPLAGWFHPSRA